MKEKHFDESLKDNKTIEFMHAMNLLRKKLEKINDTNRLDILMHMLLSKGIFDLLNNKKGVSIKSEDYTNLTKDDYIKTTENILSELYFFEEELKGPIN